MGKTKKTISEERISEIVNDAVRIVTESENRRRELAELSAIEERGELLLEMARVGRFGKKDEFEIYIHTGEGQNVPHAHIRDFATGGKKLNTCIKLESAEYFLHGPYQDLLNSYQREELAKFMESTHTFMGMTKLGYEITIYMWNMNSESNISKPRLVELKYDKVTGRLIFPNYRGIGFGK